MNRKDEYQPQPAAQTLRRIVRGEDPWLAVGQFLDDWRRTDPARRNLMIVEPLPDVVDEHLRWAAFIAAAVESLCASAGLPFPAWTSRSEYRLTEPWFLYPGWRLRAWQLAETPVPFRMRNIFGGDRILARVWEAVPSHLAGKVRAPHLKRPGEPALEQAQWRRFPAGSRRRLKVPLVGIGALGGR